MDGDEVTRRGNQRSDKNVGAGSESSAGSYGLLRGVVIHLGEPPECLAVTLAPAASGGKASSRGRHGCSRLLTVLHKGRIGLQQLQIQLARYELVDSAAQAERLVATGDGKARRSEAAAAGLRPAKPSPDRWAATLASYDRRLTQAAQLLQLQVLP